MTPGPPPLVMIARLVAARMEMREQRLRGGEDLPDGAEAHDAGATQRGVEHVVVAADRARRCAISAAGSPAGWRPTLISSTGLQRAAPRSALMKRRAFFGCPRCRGRCSRCAGRRPCSRALRRSRCRSTPPSETTAGEADVVRLRPVEDRGAQRARLARSGPIVPGRAAVGEGRFRPSDGPHDAQAVGPEQPHAVAARRLTTWRSSAAPRGPASPNPCPDMTIDRLDAGPSAALDDREDLIGAHRDDDQIESVRDVFDGTCSTARRGPIRVRVHREQAAAEAGVQHVCRR